MAKVLELFLLLSFSFLKKVVFARKGNSVWNLPERPPLLSDHLTKILIGSSISQIAISETSCKRPPKQPDVKRGHLQEVPLYNQEEWHSKMIGCHTGEEGDRSYICPNLSPVSPPFSREKISFNCVLFSFSPEIIWHSMFMWLCVITSWITMMFHRYVIENTLIILHYNHYYLAVEVKCTPDPVPLLTLYKSAENTTQYLNCTSGMAGVTSQWKRFWKHS